MKEQIEHLRSFNKEKYFHNVTQHGEQVMKEQTTMQLGMIGLGRMGANMVRRLWGKDKNASCLIAPPSSRRSGQREELREPVHWRTSLQSSSDRERSG